MEYKSDTLFIFASSSFHLWKVQNCSISIFLCRQILIWWEKKFIRIFWLLQNCADTSENYSICKLSKEIPTILIAHKLSANDKQTKLWKVEKVKQLPKFNGRIGKQFDEAKGHKKELIRIVPSWNVLLKLSSKAVKQIWIKFSFCW